MEKPNGRIMASAFVITNEVLHQAANKPPTSASVFKMYDRDDEAMVGIDAELATPSSLSPKQHVSLFYSMYKCFSNLSGHNHFCKCSERKVYNRSFGTETPIPNFFFRKDILYTQILCTCHCRCPHFLSWLFLQKHLCNRGFANFMLMP